MKVEVSKEERNAFIRGMVTGILLTAGITFIILGSILE